MKKHIKITSLAILAISVFMLCLIYYNQYYSNQVFFMQYESYVAAPKESELEIALTCFGNKNSISRMLAVSSFSFVDTSVIEIVNFSIEDSGRMAEFYTCAITLNIRFLDEKIENINSISAVSSNGKTRNYPIGSWTFDIDEGNNRPIPIDIWNTPAASSNSTMYPYSYSTKDDIFIINAIQYGEDLIYDFSLANEDKVIKGTFPVLGDAAVKYIRPKLYMSSKGKTYVAYGMGCYCGALDVTRSEIIQAKLLSK